MANPQVLARKLIFSEIDNEVQAIDKLCKNSHRNIVQVLHHGSLIFTPSVYYIDMEFCDSSLRDYLKGETVQPLHDWDIVFSQGDERRQFIQRFMQQVLEGLIFIHEQSLVHRDLSPENGNSPFFRSIVTCSVLFSSKDMAWKISDFGMTSFGTSDVLVSSHNGRGKQCYRSPELFNSPSKYNNKTDMWSLGCIVVELATKQKAFASDIEVYKYITSKATPQVLLESADDCAKEIIRDYVEDLLNLDPCKRPAARELINKLGKTLHSVLFLT
jgi:mitogen-activated protein kinase kinase kinase